MCQSRAACFALSSVLFTPTPEPHNSIAVVASLAAPDVQSGPIRYWRHEIQHDSLTFDAVDDAYLGAGAFGTVRKAVYAGADVRRKFHIGF
jgi:hypothetical protein